MAEFIQRRQFLARLWGAGTGLIAVAAAWTSWDLLQPLRTAGFGGLVRAIRPEAVPDTGIVEVAAARSYLTKVDGETIALSEKCTHLGCRVPFCESSGRFECPCHGSKFSRSGEYVAGPAPRGMMMPPAPRARRKARADMATGPYETDEELERSTNKLMAIGFALMLGLVLIFPLYRLVEPSSREAERDSQLVALATSGEQTWSVTCASCHGLNGEGGVGPALNSRQFLSSATNAQMELLISVGVPGTQMAAFSQDHAGPLTSEQIKAVVTYLRSWESTAPDNPNWRTPGSTSTTTG